MKNNSKIGIIIIFSLILTNTTQQTVFGQTSKELSQDGQAPFIITAGSQPDTIDIIGTIDYRPNSRTIELFWIGPDSNPDIECRIQKWEYKENEDFVGFYTLIASRQPDTLNIYSYADHEVKDGMVYRYKVWMKDSDKYYISQEVFTLPRPALKDWGYWPIKPEEDDTVYMNGREDTAAIESITFDKPKFWRSDSLKFKLIHNNNTLIESRWQSSDTTIYVFNLEDSLGDLSPYNGKSFYFSVQCKNNIGTTSRWSPEQTAILDFRGPDSVPWIQTTSIVSPDSTDGLIKIEWYSAFDSLSGTDHYNLLRRKGEKGDFESIAEAQNLKITSFNDPFTDIDTSTTIFYLLEAVDHVENPNFVGTNGIRCLIGPGIVIIADATIESNKYILDDTLTIECPGFDISNLVGFKTKINGKHFGRIETNALPLKIPGVDKILEDTLFIQVQALFENFQDPLVTTWSNIDSVIRVKNPPSPVTDLTVTNMLPQWAKNEYNQRDGNLYLQWTRPSEQIVGYEIWRWDEAGDSSLVATIISSLDTLKWVDRYDYNELNGIPGDTLFVFQYYTYGVKAINFFDIPSEFSNFDSDYCNRAPENVRGKIINENQVMWEVSWDPIRTHLNKGEFNYTAICYYHPLQVEKNIHQTLIVDTTVANFKVDTDKTYYCEVYAVELVSGRNDSTQKSLPMFCDFREPPFPHLKMHELELQPQPYHAGIFVCWEKYWKNNFVNGYDSSLVDLFQLTRYGMTGTAKKDTLVLDFSEDSKEWKKAQFMDDSLLISDMTYRYRIDPCIITVDGDTIKPRDYVEKSTKHDTSRVFIPKIDTIYVKGKSNPKLFFNGNKNKVSVSWYYLEQDGITKAQTSRGAATVKIQLSTNREFDQLNHPNSIATIIIPAYQNNKMFTSVDFTNIDTLNHYTNAPYFIQITAFDKWGNQHGYTTRYEDGDFKIYDDSTPPTKSNFRSIISRADTSSEVGKIQLALKWDESAEDPATESGIKWYHLNFYDINSNKQKGAWKIHNADTTLILGFPDLKNENLLNYGRYFKLIPEDRVGNIAEPDSEAWYPIPFPLYFVVKKIPNRRFTYKFEWHPSIYLEGYNIDSYYLEWHDNKYSLGDFIIRKPEFCVIIPGDKDTLRKAYNDFPGKYFHIHARIKGVNNQLQESGWSNTDSTDRQYLEKNMTMQNNDTELIVPSSFSLKQNYPNPFNNNTKIEYWVPNSNEVSIKIYNIVGKEIITLVDGKISAGIYQMYWNGKDKFNQLLPSGIYFITMKAENYHKIIKCMLLK